MKKGFTLLELLIVIIIIGVLAVIALTQYRNLSERARLGEAKSVIGAIRTAERIYHEDHSVFASDPVDLGAYINVPPSTVCANTHWFRYTLAATGGTSFTVTATRCGSGGKTPNYTGTPLYAISLTEDEAGAQTKTSTFPGGSPTDW